MIPNSRQSFRQFLKRSLVLAKNSLRYEIQLLVPRHFYLWLSVKVGANSA